MQKSTNQKSFSYLGKMGDPSYKIEGASATIYPGVFVWSTFWDQLDRVAADDGPARACEELSWVMRQMKLLSDGLLDGEEAVVVDAWEVGVGLQFSTHSSMPFSGLFLEGHVEDADLAHFDPTIFQIDWDKALEYRGDRPDDLEHEGWSCDYPEDFSFHKKVWVHGPWFFCEKHHKDVMRAESA